MTTETTSLNAPRELARRATTMPRSAIREIMALAAGQSDVFHLEVGEPDFATPAPIIEQAFAAVRAGATRYTPNAGTMHLRAKIAEAASLRYGQSIAADRVVVTTGAIGALFAALFTVVDPGDEVLLPDPGWPNYDSIIHLAGGRAVKFDLPVSRGFLPDVGQIEALITPRTKAILVNTPGNPTGAVMPPALMAALGDLTARHGIYLISDEIYEDFVFDGRHESALSVAPADRTIVVSGFSKTYAMTGWRLGYLICPPILAPIAAALQEPVTSCPSAPGQAAGEAALQLPVAVIDRFRDTYRHRRDLVSDIFAGTNILPLVPQGAFYAWLDISSTGMRSMDFAKRLLVEKRVAAVPGITFGPGSDGYLRVAFAEEETRLVEALTRIRDLVETCRAGAGQ